MALIISSIELETGVIVQNAYARIESVNGGKNGAEICLKMYISKTAFENGKFHIKQFPYQFVPSVADDALNFIKQGYEHLKSLEEFAGAIDA